MVSRACDFLDDLVSFKHLIRALEGHGTSLRLIFFGRVASCLGVVELGKVWHLGKVGLVPVPVALAVEDAEGVLPDVVGSFGVNGDGLVALVVACSRVSLKGANRQNAKDTTKQNYALPASWNKMGLGQGSVSSTFLKAMTIMLAPS